MLILLSSCLSAENYGSAQHNQVISKLDAAHIAFEVAFVVVVEAESAGVNVTFLVGKLNIAATALAQAENSYRLGNLHDTEIHAETVLPIAQEVVLLAHDAKQVAIVVNQKNLCYSVVFTIIGLCVFLFVISVSWRWFKKRYIKMLYKATLEIIH